MFTSIIKDGIDSYLVGCFLAHVAAQIDRQFIRWPQPSPPKEIFSHAAFIADRPLNEKESKFVAAHFSYRGYTLSPYMISTMYGSINVFHIYKTCDSVNRIRRIMENGIVLENDK